MPRPKEGYPLDDRKLEGVTGICRETSADHGIIAWTRKNALAGRDPHVLRDMAGGVGTGTHGFWLTLCGVPSCEEDWLKVFSEEKDPAKTVAALAEAQKEDMARGYSILSTWEEEREAQRVVYEEPFVSRLYEYGGTPDGLFLIDGLRWLVDLKTGSGVYDDHIMQLAAYRQLLWENGYQVDRAMTLMLERSKEVDEEAGFARLTGRLLEYAPDDVELAEGWACFQTALAHRKTQVALKRRRKPAVVLP